MAATGSPSILTAATPSHSGSLQGLWSTSDTSSGQRVSPAATATVALAGSALHAFQARTMGPSGCPGPPSAWPAVGPRSSPCNRPGAGPLRTCPPTTDARPAPGRGRSPRPGPKTGEPSALRQPRQPPRRRLHRPGRAAAAPRPSGHREGGRRHAGRAPGRSAGRRAVGVGPWSGWRSGQDCRSSKPTGSPGRTGARRSYLRRSAHRNRGRQSPRRRPLGLATGHGDSAAPSGWSPLYRAGTGPRCALRRSMDSRFSAQGQNRPFRSPSQRQGPSAWLWAVSVALWV